MGTYGNIELIKGNKKLELTDSHDGYFSWMGKMAMLSIKNMNEDKISELLENFDSSDEWQKVSQREKEDALYKFSLDNNNEEAIEWFKSVLKGDLRASIGGFLPMLYIGKNTSYNGEYEGGYVVDFNNRSFTFEEEVGEDFEDISLSFDIIKKASKKQIDFFAEHLYQVNNNFENPLHFVEDLKIISKEEYLKILKERNAYIYDKDYYKNLKNKHIDEIEDDYEEKQETKSFFIQEYKKAKKANNENKIKELKQQYVEKLQNFLLTDENIIDLYLQKIETNRQNSILADEIEAKDLQEFRNKDKDLTPDQNNVLHGFQSFSLTTNINSLRNFVFLVDNILLKDKTDIEKEKVLQCVSWGLEFDESKNQEYGVIQITSTHEDQNKEIKNFANLLMNNLDYKFNIYSSSYNISEFEEERKNKPKNYIYSYISAQEFSEISKEHKQAVKDLHHSLPFSIKYDELREYVLKAKNFKEYSSISYLKMAVLNRDLKSFNKLISFVQEDFKKIPDEWKKNAAEGLLSCFSDMILFEDTIQKLNIEPKDYQINTKNFIENISPNFNFLVEYMTEREKILFSQTNSSQSKTKKNKVK